MALLRSTTVSHALLLASLVALTNAEAFLKSRVDEAREVDLENVKQVMLAELSGRTDIGKLQGIEAKLHPLFASLPKNALGRLEAPLVRYALTRYFVQEHGWYVKGLDATWSRNESNSSVLKARAPAYIQSLLEENLHGHGFGLRELAVFVATLSDLIHAEAVGQLESIHSTMGLSTTGALSGQDAEKAIEAFLVAYLLGGWVKLMEEGTTDVSGMKNQMLEQYPNYPETRMWLQDFQRTYDLEQMPRRNPFVERPRSFDDSAAFVVEFSHRFVSFQNLECHELKRKLIDMEASGTGRVRMADFYSSALSGHWEFMESIEYLRNQGVLDESEPSRPSVVIPNYINSLANCLTASDFYGVCCRNECNDLLGHVERAVLAPRAVPARIAEVVSSLQSETVDAPRELSSALLARLDQIAEHHDGAVPLHGRLFAQWMHHAYPRECPFPHLSGSVNPQSPQEYAAANGFESLEISVEEMQAHASWMHENFTAKVLPWIQEEELMETEPVAVGRDARLSTVMAIVALVSFAAPLLHTLRLAMGGLSETKAEKYLV